MKQLLSSIFLTTLLLLCSTTMAANWLPAPAKISTHAWAWIGPYEAPSKTNHGFRMNMGFVIGNNAVAIIDSGYSPDMANEMMRHIRSITPLPVRYVINTNSQPHRHFGNDVFKAIGANIIAAREAAMRMSNEGNQFATGVANALEVKKESIRIPAAPTQLIDAGKNLALDLGGDVVITVTHYGQTHTHGSLIVEVSPDKTVFAGDILYSGRLLAVLTDSSVTGWIAAYKKLRTLPAKLFVPGHGPASALSEFDLPTYEYLTALKAHMNKAVEDGIDASTASASFDTTKWKNLAIFAELSGRNASLTYLESEAENF